MPHNPRRPRTPIDPDRGLTTERIAAAMERARALRSVTAVYPAEIRCIPLAPSEATSRTKRRGVHMPWEKPDDDDGPARDPWCLVGWLRHEHVRGGADRWDADRYSRIWGVWLNLDDDRVWLKPERR